MAPDTANGPSLLITPSTTTAAIHPTADSLRGAFRPAACPPEGEFYQDQKMYCTPARTLIGGAGVRNRWIGFPGSRPLTAKVPNVSYELFVTFLSRTNPSSFRTWTVAPASATQYSDSGRCRFTSSPRKNW